MEKQATMGFWSPRRFGQLLLREAVSGYRGLLIAMAAVGGALILITALTAIGFAMSGRGPGSDDFYVSFFNNLLFLGGFIVTSLAFREVWQNSGGIFYLTIPGSIFEKFTSKLIVTSIGYAVGSAIFFTAAAAIAEGVSILIAGSGHGFFNPLDYDVLRSIVIYLVVQSVFLLGSIWFRKGAFLRTVLWIAIFGIAAGIVAAVVARFALADHFVWQVAGAGPRFGGWNLDIGSAQLQRLIAPGTRGYAGLMVFETISRVGFWLLAPVMWVAAYFRLGEAEV
jgi:hypothetical protein